MKIRIFVLLAVLAVSSAAGAINVITVDFLSGEVNGVGPMLVQADPVRNRLVTVNTISSSVSIIDCLTGNVMNIPTAGRGYQHLKAECITIRSKTGEIYLIGKNCLTVVDPEEGNAKTIKTDVQFESVAVDEETGNVFVAGRESKKLGFLKAGSAKIKYVSWLEKEEPLINLNATPPPPIRKVVADGSLGKIVAVDGIDPALYVFDGGKGKLEFTRQLGLSAGGRWHLGGYDEEGHYLFIVTETSKRKVVEAARIDVRGEADIVVALPEYTEGVGIIYNPVRKEVYIPYDNHPSVHVVNFEGEGSLEEIKIPAYGNDASALDLENGLLFIGSWAHGEIDVIDLEKREMISRTTGLGIIPHMFTIAFNPVTGLVYFPKGATAVNGAFGAAISSFDWKTGETGKVRTGWAPIELIELPGRESFLVFDNEDGFAEVKADGSFTTHRLPFDYPVSAVYAPGGDIYLSYGPHQSYWPTVYIWDAKNGILTIDKDDFSYYDRRIPKQAHKMVVDSEGVLYFTQNNWGKEEQFVGRIKDKVRVNNINERIKLGEDVEREITQRILAYDEDLHRLYLVKTGEKDDEPSVLHVIDPDSSSVIGRAELGLTSTDLVFDGENIYVTNFDSRSVSVIDKNDFTVIEVEAGKEPLKLAKWGKGIYAIDHAENRVLEIGGKGKSWKLPEKGKPDNIFAWGGLLVVTSHSDHTLYITRFDPGKGSFSVLHSYDYPYGDTSFGSANVSFYMRGQFADAVFEITKGRVDREGRLWVTDLLSGKLFIIEE